MINSCTNSFAVSKHFQRPPLVALLYEAHVQLPSPNLSLSCIRTKNQETLLLVNSSSTYYICYSTYTHLRLFLLKGPYSLTPLANQHHGKARLLLSHRTSSRFQHHTRASSRLFGLCYWRPLLPRANPLVYLFHRTNSSSRCTFRGYTRPTCKNSLTSVEIISGCSVTQTTQFGCFLRRMKATSRSRGLQGAWREVLNLRQCNISYVFFFRLSIWVIKYLNTDYSSEIHQLHRQICRGTQHAERTWTFSV